MHLHLGQVATPGRRQGDPGLPQLLLPGKCLSSVSFLAGQECEAVKCTVVYSNRLFSSQADPAGPGTILLCERCSIWSQGTCGDFFPLLCEAAALRLRSSCPETWQAGHTELRKILAVGGCLPAQSDLEDISPLMKPQVFCNERPLRVTYNEALAVFH